ncbi:class I SAM-dependent methyltransferase [Spongorhabdus nitratireducens]
MNTLNDQYDSIARLYRESKNLGFRECIETYTLFSVLGDVCDETVYDLACGDGFYTRKIRQAGAISVTGIDISSEMINLAQENERTYPLGCNYIRQDVAEIQCSKKASLVIAIYLLNYAQNKDELLKLVKVAFSLLQPGGRFIGYNENAKYLPKMVPSYKKYGFEKVYSSEIKEGDKILYKWINEDGSCFDFQCYFYKSETYAWAFSEAGFEEFRWVGPFLNPDEKDNNFWDTYMSSPPSLAFSALKPKRK